MGPGQPDRHDRRRLLGTAGVLAAALLFSTTGTSRTLLAPDAPALEVAAARLAVGAVGMVVVVALLVRGGRADLGALARRPLAWVMALGVAGYQGFFFLGVDGAGVAVGTLVALGSAPLLSGLLAWAVGAGAPGRAWLLATVLAVAGLALLTGLGGGAPSVAGVVAALGAGASYAVYTVLGARLATEGYDGGAVLAVPFALGAVLLSPWLVGGLVAAGRQGDEGWLGTPDGWALVLWLGLAATSAAYLLFGLGLAVLPAGHIATLTLLEPVGATLLGVLLLGEVLGAAGWLGCALVLAGLAVLGAASGRAPLPAPAAVGDPPRG